MKPKSTSSILALPSCYRTLTAVTPKVTIYDKLRKGYPQSLDRVGDHIRRRRLDAGLTLDQAADLLGVSRWSVHEWEKHRRFPADAFRQALTAFIGYDASVGSRGRDSEEEDSQHAQIDR